jgi:phosphoglucomutase
MNSITVENINKWLSEEYDENTHQEILRLQEENPQELEDAFYKTLKFGTGGLRGIMGVGTNRMNKYTVGSATQGFALYLKRCFPNEVIKVVVSYDSRNNSRYFAEITADIFTANKIHCFLFDEMRPTPILSFAVRHLQCQGGVMITASHNPKEYNGYKAYWQDGGQLVPPHDQNVINYVNRAKSVNKIKWQRNNLYFHRIGTEVDNAYLALLKKQMFNTDEITHRKKFKIVYTPLHGTGITMVPKALEALGFRHVVLVDEQSIPDGNFPTVESPNPEETSAMQMALNKAEEVNADIVLGTDPDADRVALAIKDPTGKYVLLNGNQTATLLFYYVLSQKLRQKALTDSHFTVKTIVTSELLQTISLDFNIPCYNVLTGFKYIAEKILEKEGKENFLVGGEESFGYLVGDFVRDKDAISACCILAEMAVHAISNQSSAYKELLNIYKKYFFPKEHLLSITKKGKEGLQEIRNMMKDYRHNPPKEIAGQKVVIIKDYQERNSRNLLTGERQEIQLPVSDVLQFYLEDNTVITVRPSGTEPKIKFYFGVSTTLKKFVHFDKCNQILTEKIAKIISDLNLN